MKFAAVVAIGVLLVAAGPNAAPPTSADELASQLLKTATTTGFRARATMTTTIKATGEQRVRQLLIVGRRDLKSASMLYQQLWPAETGGRALVLNDAGDHQVAGFVYRGGKSTPLGTEMSGDPFFESDIHLEDLAQAFWFWPARTIVGKEAIGEYDCAIVQFRPGAATRTDYSSIKAWIAPALGEALRVEEYGRDGRLVKRIGLYRVLHINGGWVPTIVTVEPADGKSRTVVEGVSSEPTSPLGAPDFSVAAIRKSLAPAVK